MGQFLHGADQPGLVVDDLHGPPAQDVGRPYQDREAHPLGDAAGAFHRGRSTSCWLGNLEPGAQGVPAFAVLRRVDRRRRGAQHQLGGQQVGQLERGLAAEGDDHPGDRAGALLGLDDVEHVLVGQRFEVEPVRGVVVGRHGLGVAVDHDRLVARFGEGETGVHAAVVELDPLSDAVGTRPEDQHPRFGRRRDLVLVLPGRVVVRRLRGELRRARVHRLERGQHPGRDPGGPHPRLVGPPQVGQLGVAEPQLFDSAPVAPGQPRRAAGGRQPGPFGAEAGYLVQEPGVDLRVLEHPLDGDPPPQRRLDAEEAVRGGDRDPLEQRLVVEGVPLGLAGVAIEPEATLFEAAHGLLQRLGERPADGHDLTDGLHLGAQHPEVPGNFSKANAAPW